MLRSFRASLPLIFMIMTAGSDGQQGWGVTYNPSYVCALKGSTVKIFCVLKYPSNHNLTRVFWTKPVTDGEPPDLGSDPEKTGRVQCVSEYKDTSSMTLTGVTEADKHIYYCRFTTNTESGKWTGVPGVQLDVTDLQVETQQTVKEGDSVTLRCKSSCSLPEETTFIWYRNTERVNKGIARLNQFHLPSVRGSDAGNYRCAVRGKAGETPLISPPVYLNVEWVDGLWDRGVYYSPSYVCALKGSTVKISCIQTYSGFKLIPAFWTKPPVTGEEPQNLCSDPDRRGGIDCYAKDEDTSSITLTGVTKADKHIYYCRITDTQNKRWIVIPGARLDITDLQVETQQIVKEGGSVTLRCKSSCSLTEETTFIWYRNKEMLTEPTLNQLHLRSVHRSDAGNYRCAVRGKEHLISPPVYLHVEFSAVYGLQYRGVNYSPSYVCALKRSTVKISCTSTYSSYYMSTPAFWTKTTVSDGHPPNLCSDPEKRGRFKCESNYKGTSSMTLTGVTEADKHIYYCRITDIWYERWTVLPGAWLDVTDLQVETQQTVKEGDSVTLRCKSSCSLTEETTFIWYRNTERVNKGNTTLNQLHLESVSHSDAGDYSCAGRGKAGETPLISPPVYLSVEYPPKSVSVSIIGSAEIVSGDSVTLSCSSDSNPPALSFSWFKEETSLGSGEIYRITNITFEASGNYSCSARNKHGSLNSSSVTVNVRYPPRSVSVSISGSAEIVSGDSVTLSCSSDSNPPALNFSWFKENQSSAVGSGQIFSISSFNFSHSGRYYCEAHNPHGSRISASVSVTVKGVQRAALLTPTGIVVGCGGLIFIFIIFIIVLIKKKRRDGGAEDSRQNQQDPIGRSALTNDSPVYSVVSDNQIEDLYDNVKAKKPKHCRRDSGEVDEVQYASVQHFKNKDKTEEHQKMEMLCLSDANRSEDIIYSSVK